MTSSSSDRSDEELIQQFQQSTGERKKSAFTELYDRYREPLWKYILKMTGNKRRTNEFFQETVLRAMRGLDDFQGKSSFKTWIYSIAINIWRNHLKKKRPKSGIVDEEEELFEDTPDDLVEKQEELENVRNALHSLPDKFRIPLLLVRFEDMKYREAAETMGISLEALRMRIHRGQKKLKELLVESGETDNEQR